MPKKGYTTIDAALVKETALPKTASTVYTDAIDCGPISDIGVRSEKFEFEIETPALNGTQLPSGASVSYQIQASDDPDFSGNVSEWSITELTQSGASAGTAGKTSRFKPALDSPRFWRSAATLTGTAGASIANAKFSIKHIC